MIPKKKRLNRAVFSYVLQGKSIHFPLFSLRVSKAMPGEERFSVVVSKKVALRAVKRNILRRAVYDAVRESKATGFSAIVYLKKEASTVHRRVLHELVVHVFSDLGRR